MSVIEVADPVEAVVAGSGRRFSWKAAAIGLLAAGLLVELDLVVPYLGRALSTLDDPDLRWVLLAVAAEVVSMGAFARARRRMLAAGGTRVSARRMVGLTYAANAVNASLPGGAALAVGLVFRRLRSWGATVPAAGFTILASGVLSSVSFALLAIVAAVVAGDGGTGSVLVIAVVVAAVLAALVGRRFLRPGLGLQVVSAGLVRANRVLRRPADAGLAQLRRLIVDVTAIRPRNRDWLAGLAFAGLNWLADLVCLVASCRAVDARGVTLVVVLVAYIAGMSAAGLSLLPGGLGVVDAAMIFALTQGGIGVVPATAAVLLYRAVSLVLVVAVGWVALGVARVSARRARRSPVGIQPVGSTTSALPPNERTGSAAA
ncbi:MAG TPA: YbhN family protein [Jatrophihabitans sp.]|jgi:hypothetical protein|uniref:lysylphosphatidylglycerol synthase transmembrane domain-containing protein n=1 Tax=Jatrophihabitans sp. TaxID=1932789 RepID=UPI002DFBB38C|nr:YbhN family protein [Jatrophihabitans sp.]